MSQNNFHTELLIAGFGGQGIMLSGKLLAQAAMISNFEVTYMPSYGAEVRGGTANCMVVISDEPIGSPLVTHPDSLIIMNKVSINKFLPLLKPSGLLIFNSSMIKEHPIRPDIEIIPVPADEIAMELNSPKSANMVAVGAYLQKLSIITPDTAAQSLTGVLAKRYHKTIPVNQQAIQRGAQYVQAGQFNLQNI